MTTRGSRFVVVPNITQAGINPAQYALFSSLKENIELLIGARGDVTRAVVRGQVTVRAVDKSGDGLSAQGSGVTISGAAVPTLDEYHKLLADVRRLNTELNAVRDTLNTLISQIRT